jgi:hypothetical protein
MARTFRIILTVMLVAVVGPVECKIAWAKGQNIRVAAVDDFGLTLEFTAPPFQIEEVTGPDGAYQRLHQPGSAKTSRKGYPELPATGTLIQVPSSGDLTIQVLENVYESLPNLEIGPVPRLSIKRSDKFFIKDDKAYQFTDFLPGTIAALSPRETIRGVPVVRVMVYPFQWNPATKELLHSKQVRLRINFQNPLPASELSPRVTADATPGEVFGKILKKSIANYQGPGATAVAATAAKGGKPKPPPPSSQGPLRIEVKQAGIYRISYSDLTKAGISAGAIEPGTFQVLNRGQEVAIKVVTSLPGQFRSGDYLEFSGQAVNNAFTSTNVYWLYWGKQSGMRMATISGNITKKATIVASFGSRLHVEENRTIWENTPGAPDTDYWFWARLTGPVQKSYSVVIPAPVGTGGTAVLRACFRGYSTASPHHTRVSLNGGLIREDTWNGDQEYIQEMPVSSPLTEGTNTVTVELPGSNDSVYFNWLEVDYQRRLQAVEDALTFTVSGSGRVQMAIGGLSQSTVEIFDITNPQQVKAVVGFTVRSDAGAYKATFEDTLSGAKTYSVVTAGKIKSPDALKLWTPTNLKGSGNGADYILITARDYLSAVAPLVSWRQQQGFRVATVAVEDIFNEFSYGLFDPTAIKDFLRYAYGNWQTPAPTYVFLLGDANTDYRDYLGTGKKNVVPVHLSNTADLGVTPDDNWYVAFEEGNILPQMAIGRIPANSSTMAASVADKIVKYENLITYRPQEGLFVADNNDLAFEELNERLIGHLPTGFGARRVYLRSYANVSTATQAIIADINAGMLLTNYVGHGDVTHWTGDGLFDSTKISQLTNENKLTFVTALECLNGYFSQPFRYCLGEEFVIALKKGAIASFAPSGLGYTWEHDILGNELFASIFEENHNILGAITTQAKIDAFALGATEDLVKTFVLLGDPATRLAYGQ